MGFASYFEDIMDKLGGDFRAELKWEPQKGTNIKESRLSQTESKANSVPPEEFTERLFYLLKEDGCPEYLLDYFNAFIWEFKDEKTSMDQALNEFLKVVMPLITTNLQRKDSVTIRFVQSKLGLNRKQMSQRDLADE